MIKLVIPAKMISDERILTMNAVQIAIISAASAIALLLIIYLFLAAPKRSRRAQTLEFARVKYAHRGLHGGTRAENSLSAFAAAVEKGYGIELDVRLSRDGELVVFHDDTLERMTDAEGRVDSKTLSELKELSLGGGEEKIPTFAEVLALVDGKVPLLVEIKEDAFKYGVTEKTAEMLKNYKGRYMIESFNPLAVQRFKKLMPSVIRGQLAENYLKQKKYRKPMYFLLQFFMLNFLASPDFIAYNHQECGTVGFGIQRHVFRPALFAWTVRSAEAESAAKKHGFDGIIFEDYTA